MNNGTVLTSIRDTIATITFYHPARNSFPTSMLNRLIESVNRLGKDDKVRVIILQSEGDRTFCAGAFFDELLLISNIEEGNKFFIGFANLINAMRKCPKLIIGRVQGKAVGGVLVS